MQRVCLLVLLALLTLPLASAAWGQQHSPTPNQEKEKIIRTAYAKMSYADEVRIVLDGLVQTGREKLWSAKANTVDQALDSRLSFQLGEFAFGKISKIADRKMSQFDGSPTWIGGDVLDVTPSTYDYSVNNSAPVYVAYIKFAWKPSPYHFLPPAENWSIAKALQAEQFEGKRYTDYATYTVTVTFDDKSRTYKAWALFREEEKGKLQPYFMDAIADPTAIAFALDHSLYPAAFADTDLHTVPFVDKWLHDNARSCESPHSEADKNRTDVCCDPYTAHCGIAKTSLAPRESRRHSPAQPKLVLASFHLPSQSPIHAMQSSAAATTCAKFNVNTTFPHALADIQEHDNNPPGSGSHGFAANVVASCTYTEGGVSPGPCNVQCSAQSSSVIDEKGPLTGAVFAHATSKTDSSGGDFSNGGTAPISCLGLSAGTVKSCTFPCSTSVSIAAGGKGNLGATINFPPSNLWNDQNQGQVTCNPRSSTNDKTAGGGCGQACGDPCINSATVGLAQGPVGSFTHTGGPTDPLCSPILIDTEGEGFHLTSADNGVMFDISGNGHPLRIAWTAPGSHNAFLALDRDGSGTITSGKELFGNFTAQPASSNPNGFLALAEFDKPEKGGNGDGIIDEHDSVYSNLRLWIDKNHDGVAQPSELHTLPELGVFSLGLRYAESRKTDEFGNQFRYRDMVNPGLKRDKRDDVGRYAYDVFFVTK
jgi:hypothetical protein